MLGFSEINVLNAVSSFTVLPEVSGVYKFTLDDSKEYLVTKISDLQYIVERNYDSASCCDRIRTATAKLFNKTNRQKISAALVRQPSLLPESKCSDHFEFVLPNLPNEMHPQCSKEYLWSIQYYFGDKYKDIALLIGEELTETDACQPIERERKYSSSCRFGTSRFCVLDSNQAVFHQGTANQDLVIDLHGRIQVFHIPTEPVITEKPVIGSEKILVAQDASFVKLTPLKGNTFNVHKLDMIAEALQSYSSCCPSFAIDETRIIAKNGGIGLHIHCHQNNNVIDIIAYWYAARDLARMHIKGIFIRDIKAENLAIGKVPSRNGQLRDKVFFIDTDETWLPDFQCHQQYEEGKYTPEVCTPEILSGRNAGDVKTKKIADEYALLVTMMETTSDDKKLKFILEFESDEVRSTKSASTQERTVKPPKTVMTSENNDAVRHWIKENIKKEFRGCVHNFLFCPTSNPLPCSLFHVIDW